MQEAYCKSLVSFDHVHLVLHHPRGWGFHRTGCQSPRVEGRSHNLYTKGSSRLREVSWSPLKSSRYLFQTAGRREVCHHETSSGWEEEEEGAVEALEWADRAVETVEGLEGEEGTAGAEWVDNRAGHEMLQRAW